MTPTALAKNLFTTYGTFRLDHLNPHRCRHQVVQRELRDLADRGGDLLQVRELGVSIEGRAITQVSCGRGPRNVLLWSQMHGDEPTATLALMDLLNFLVLRASETSWIQTMLRQCTISAIPMLNPDGAERWRRHTAAQIDMNRDARTLATPEARILRDAHRFLAPSFAFNLHDQLPGSVGSSASVSALALLAPPLDERRTTPLVRLRAMRVAALIVRALNQFIEGHITTYDDTHEPRAFGDSMQSWGTSTLLVESGHWPKDPEKAFIRKLNAVALLTALRSIADGSYQDVELEEYKRLKPNGKQIFDVIIRNVIVTHTNGWSHTADIGLLYETGRPHSPRGERKSAAPSVTVKEVGDLATHAGLETIAGHRRKISSVSVTIDRTVPLSALLDELQLYYSSSQR